MESPRKTCFFESGQKYFAMKLVVFFWSCVVMLDTVPTASSAPFTKSPTSTRKICLLNKHGKFLAITKNKALGIDSFNYSAVLELETFGMNGEVRIRGVQANRYLAIDGNGKIHLRKKPKNDAVFINQYLAMPKSKGVQQYSPYSCLKSKVHQSIYLAINTQGLVSSSKDVKDTGAHMAYLSSN